MQTAAMFMSARAGDRQTASTCTPSNPGSALQQNPSFPRVFLLIANELRWKMGD